MKLNMKQKLDAKPSHINPVLQPFYYSRKGDLSCFKIPIVRV